MVVLLSYCFYIPQLKFEEVPVFDNVLKILLPWWSFKSNDIGIHLDTYIYIFFFYLEASTWGPRSCADLNKLRADVAVFNFEMSKILQMRGLSY